MEVLIRKAKAKDVDEVYTVLLEMIASEDISAEKVSPFILDIRKRKPDFEISAKKELLREFREKNSAYLIAEIDKKTVGYIRGTILENQDPFFTTKKIGYLNALVVMSTHAGKGIASKLNQSLEKWFKDNECSQIHLEVFENNHAIQIYEKWGYVTFNRKMAKKL